MKEIWMPNPKDDKYLISSYGNIKTRYHKIRNNKGQFETIVSDSWHVVKQFNHSCGYLVFNMQKNGSAKMVYSHRVVASVFIPKESNSLIVNHKNGVKNDNRVSNLEWVTHSENHKHAFRTGIRKPSKTQIESAKARCGENNATSKLKRKDVVNIKHLFSDKNLSNKEIGDMFGVSRSTIYSIRKGITWKHILPEINMDVFESEIESYY